LILEIIDAFIYYCTISAAGAVIIIIIILIITATDFDTDALEEGSRQHGNNGRRHGITEQMVRSVPAQEECFGKALQSRGLAAGEPSPVFVFAVVVVAISAFFFSVPLLLLLMMWAFLLLLSLSPLALSHLQAVTTALKCIPCFSLKDLG